jgi:hypothetical protein
MNEVTLLIDGPALPAQNGRSFQRIDRQSGPQQRGRQRLTAPMLPLRCIPRRRLIQLGRRRGREAAANCSVLQTQYLPTRPS